MHVVKKVQVNHSSLIQQIQKEIVMKQVQGRLQLMKTMLLLNIMLEMRQV